MLHFVGDGDQKKCTKNPRHFSMQNSQANSKKKSAKCFWRAVKVTNFFHEKCSESFPKVFEPLSVGPKKSRKIPAKFPAESPSSKSKESSPTSAGSREEAFFFFV